MRAQGAPTILSYKSICYYIMKNARDRYAGFTLIEILVVMTIMVLFLAMMPRLFTGHDAQMRFDETRERMLEIREALLGSSGAYVNGQRQFTGYVTDMGNLPKLDGNGMPESLWKRGSLPAWGYRKTSKIWMGWRGPYVEERELRDGWGNRFKFITGPSRAESLEAGDMKIKSLGADGKKGGTEYDQDMELTIRETEYVGPVAGQARSISGNSINVQIQVWYPSSGVETRKVIEHPGGQGFFRFEQGATGEGEADLGIPMGVRSIVLTAGATQKEMIFCVEPTGNWLGTLILE